MEGNMKTYKNLIILVIMILLIVNNNNILYADCNTYRVYSKGGPSAGWYIWQIDITTWRPILGTCATTVTPGANVYDNIFSSSSRLYPWGKLYDFPGAEWISLNSAAKTCVYCWPSPTSPCVYRYDSPQFSLDDTISRATMWISVDDAICAIDLRDLITFSTISVPLPSIPLPGNLGFQRLWRIDITDFIRRDVPKPHPYRFEIYVKDVKIAYSGLIFYFSADEDDREDNYSFFFGGHWNGFSFSFYPEYPPGTKITTIFPGATQVSFNFPDGSSILMPASNVTLDGETGDWLRTYGAGIFFPTFPPAFTVRGTSIWEKRFLDIDNNRPIYIGGPDCTVHYDIFDPHCPDDYPDTKVQPTFWQIPTVMPGGPSADAIPTYQYEIFVNPIPHSLPYSLDLIEEPCCGSTFRSGSYSVTSNYTYIDSFINVPDYTKNLILSCTPSIPDTDVLYHYFDSLAYRETLDYRPDTSSYSWSPDSGWHKRNISTFKLNNEHDNKIVTFEKSEIKDGYLKIIFYSNSNIIGKLTMVDMAGRHIKNIPNLKLDFGYNVFWLKLDDIPSGKYVIRFVADKIVISKTITIVK